MDTMGDALRSLPAELREQGREHDPRQERHDDRLRNLEPETAALLAVLVRSGRRRRLLEIGTSNGYSTVWLAGAVRPRLLRRRQGERSGSARAARPEARPRHHGPRRQRALTPGGGRRVPR